MASKFEEKSNRSVFVGNIPYEATEEQLKEIFQQVGPVGSFRIVYDRETGKPKGYGFCEYQDVETAQSAMRNLNDYEYHGRTLRVSSAAGDQVGLVGPVEENPYGDAVEPEKAPEAISKAVASLPPEHMFELMKQMKLCIQNNPNEARNMLLQNPQLAYALLQAQIVMKIVDPQVALAMLHRQTDQIPPLIPTPGSSSGAPPPAVLGGLLGQHSPGLPQAAPPSSMGQGDMDPRMPPTFSSTPPMSSGAGPMPGPRGPPMPDPRGPPMPTSLASAPAGFPIGGPRGGPPGPEFRPPGLMGHAPRAGLLGDRPDFDPGMASGGPRGPPPGQPGGMQRPPQFSEHGPGPNLSRSPANFAGGSSGPPTSFPGGAGAAPPPSRDPRGQRVAPPGPAPGPPQPPRQQAPPPAPATSTPSSNNSGMSPQDQEKAALIMQVLQLTDDQIAMLPPDQRQSILILKEQIARSGGMR